MPLDPVRIDTRPTYNDVKRGLVRRKCVRHPEQRLVVGINPDRQYVPQCNGCRREGYDEPQIAPANEQTRRLGEMVSRELPALRDVEAISPALFEQEIRNGHEKAQLLTKIVKDRKLSQTFGATEHLRVEAWQILGMGYGLSCRTKIKEVTRDLTDEGEYISVQAQAELLDITGTVRGGAEGFCDNSEAGHKEHTVSQIAGMAQTRAESRAYKENLSWVAELAGFSPTPAEEMAGIKAAEIKEAGMKGQVVCPQDGSPMRLNQWGRWSHPTGKVVKGKKEWHNFTPEELAQYTQETLQDDQEAPSEGEEVSQVVAAAQKAVVGTPANIGEVLTWAMEGRDLKQKLTKAQVAAAAGITPDQIGPNTDSVWLWGQVKALYGT